MPKLTYWRDVSELRPVQELRLQHAQVAVRVEQAHVRSYWVVLARVRTTISTVLLVLHIPAVRSAAGVARAGDGLIV